MRCIAGILILLASCSGEAPPPRAPAEPTAILPKILADLLLADGSDEITPVVFDHAAHADASAPDRPGACSTCHHPLRADPEAIPRPCVACHPLEPVDAAPPDL